MATRRQPVIAATEERFLRDRLHVVLSHPGVERLVERYLQGPPLTSFAGVLFDRHNPNPIDRVVDADIAAVSLLDVRFGPQAFHEILVEQAGQEDLAKVSSTTPLWGATDNDLTSLRAAYQGLRACDGVGRTKASKLLARKRPEMAPITDSIVEKVLSTSGWAHLETLRNVLRDNGELVERMKVLSRGAVTPLRALDIAIWMIGSGSKAAKAARRECGSPDWSGPPA